METKLNLKGIPQEAHANILFTNALLNDHGFELKRKPREIKFKIIPIIGKVYYNPITKERLSTEEAYSLYA